MKLLLSLCAMLLCAPCLADDTASASADPMKDLAAKSGCFSCHDMKAKVVGPAYLSVADKYRNEPGQAAVLVEKILGGSKGTWGRIAMPPNAVSREDAKKLAEWVLSTRGDSSSSTTQTAKQQ